MRAWLPRSATPDGASLSRRSRSLLPQSLKPAEQLLFRCFKRGLPLASATAGRAPPPRCANFIRKGLALRSEGAERVPAPLLPGLSKALTRSPGTASQDSSFHPSSIGLFATRGNDRRLLISSRIHSAQPGVLAALVIFRDPSPLPGCSATIANVRFRGLAQALVTSRGPQPLSDDSPRMTTWFAGYSRVPSSPSAGHHRSRGIRQRSQPGLSQDAHLGLQDLFGGMPRSRGDPMGTPNTFQGAHRNPRNLSEASIARQGIRRREPGLLRGARAGPQDVSESSVAFQEIDGRRVRRGMLTLDLVTPHRSSHSRVVGLTTGLSPPPMRPQPTGKSAQTRARDGASRAL